MGDFETTDIVSGSSGDFDTTMTEFDTTDSSDDFDTTETPFEPTDSVDFDTTDVDSDSDSAGFETTDIDSGSIDFDTTDVDSGSDSIDFETTEVDSESADLDTSIDVPEPTDSVEDGDDDSLDEDTIVDEIDTESSEDDDAVTGPPMPPMPTQTAGHDSDSVDMETTPSSDDDSDDSDSDSDSEEGFETTEDSVDDTTTPIPVPPCVMPPTADSPCVCFDGPFVDGCPQGRCTIIILNNEAQCVDVVTNAPLPPFPTQTGGMVTATAIVDGKSGSGSGSGSEDSVENVAMIGKESENSDDLAKASESATVTTVVGLLSGALLICVVAVGAAFCNRMRSKPYVNMHALETVEMNGICEGNETGFGHHIVQCQESDEEEDQEDDHDQVKDTLIYGDQ